MPGLQHNEPSLRDMLKTRTRAEHDRVEADYAGFDLADQSGQGCMVAAHHLSLLHLATGQPDGCPWSDETLRLCALASRALESLGLETTRRLQPRDEPAHPLGAAYVVLGSRLGVAVLEARLTAARGEVPAPVRAYFSDRGSRAPWRDLQARLASITAIDEQDAIIAGARSAFDTFGSAARQVARETA